MCHRRLTYVWSLETVEEEGMVKCSNPVLCSHLDQCILPTTFTPYHAIYPFRFQQHCQNCAMPQPADKCTPYGVAFATPYFMLFDTVCFSLFASNCKFSSQLFNSVITCTMPQCLSYFFLHGVAANTTSLLISPIV